MDVAWDVKATRDVTEGALGSGGADAGQQTGERGCHDTAKRAPVDEQGQQRDEHVDGHVVVQQAQHGAPTQLDEYERKAEEDGQTGFEHDVLLDASGPWHPK
jgi:hypothetical protein